MAPKTAEHLAMDSASSAAPRKAGKSDPSIAPDPLTHLAAALGITPTKLRSRYATYATPSISLAGRSCPSDVQWTRIRDSETMPADTTLRAHLRSCVRCVPRARAWLGLDRWRRLEAEAFPRELLCLDLDVLVQSIESPERIPTWAALHLKNCATCRDDRDASDGPEVSRDVAQRLMEIHEELRRVAQTV